VVLDLLQEGQAGWCDEKHEVALIVRVSLGANELAADIAAILSTLWAKGVNSTADGSKGDVEAFGNFGLGEPRVLSDDHKESPLAPTELWMNSGKELTGSQRIAGVVDGHGRCVVVLLLSSSVKECQALRCVNGFVTCNVSINAQSR
jgi:hypothetical protein